MFFEKMTDIGTEGSINGAFDCNPSESNESTSKLMVKSNEKEEKGEEKTPRTDVDLSSELKRYIEWELHNAVGDLKFELKKIVQDETRKTLLAVSESSKDLKSIVETGIENCTNTIVENSRQTGTVSEEEEEKYFDQVDCGNDSDEKSADLSKSKFEIVFKHQDKIVPSRGNLLTTIPTLGREYHVHFSFTPGVSSTGSRNIFHMSSDVNSGVYGHCIPAVNFLSAKKCFSIVSAVNGEHGYKQTTATALPSENTYNIDIIQEHNEGKYYTYKIYLNDILLHAALNNDARAFNSVNVYVSNPWTNEQPGVMDNLVIKTIL